MAKERLLRSCLWGERNRDTGGKADFPLAGVPERNVRGLVAQRSVAEMANRKSFCLEKANHVLSHGSRIPTLKVKSLRRKEVIYSWSNKARAGI